jgi:NADPH-dependent glutamate synthase beta subunit-like oxidoreductase
VILGCGATANDNAVRALFAGAADVTLVYRRQRRFMTAYASYLVNELICDNAITDPISSFLRRFRKFVDALKKGRNAVDC